MRTSRIERSGVEMARRFGGARAFFGSCGTAKTGSSSIGSSFAVDADGDSGAPDSFAFEADGDDSGAPESTASGEACLRRNGNEGSSGNPCEGLRPLELSAVGKERLDEAASCSEMRDRAG